nr:hypothetical protein [Acidocella sp.]
MSPHRPSRKHGSSHDRRGYAKYIEYHPPKHRFDVSFITSEHTCEFVELLIGKRRFSVARIDETACRVHVQAPIYRSVKAFSREKPMALPVVMTIASATFRPALRTMRACACSSAPISEWSSLSLALKSQRSYPVCAHALRTTIPTLRVLHCVVAVFADKDVRFANRTFEIYVFMHIFDCIYDENEIEHRQTQVTPGSMAKSRE